MKGLQIRFDDGPGPVSGRFIETEDLNGRGVCAGEWMRDGKDWLLVLDPEKYGDIADARERCAEIAEEMCRRRHGSKEPCGDACCDFCATAHFIRLGEDPPPFTGLESPALHQADTKGDSSKVSNPTGNWECPKCGFFLHKRVIDADTGRVGISTKPIAEACPNDGEEMRPVSAEEMRLQTPRPLTPEEDAKVDTAVKNVRARLRSSDIQRQDDELFRKVKLPKGNWPLKRGGLET